MRSRPCIVFLLSLILYLICLDPGASLWDCPEYILVAWRLEVGHPPGNPTWQLIANVVSHLGGSAGSAAVIINVMSAVATAAAAALLCEIIFIFIRYAILRGGARRNARAASWCAVCGALCFAWCDSVIFSAVEAEVYALSIMFTALTVWLSMKWAQARLAGRQGRSRRIAILTWYVMGLSMGVHELNLLALPAMGLVYWYVYRSLRPSARPLTRTLTTSLWGILFFLVGCTTYLIIPIRAAANPPVNQGDASTPAAFRAYYGRDQYGSKPLVYGKTPYSKPLLREEIDEDGEYVYTRYYIKEKGGKKEYVYPSALNMWLPRMTSDSEYDIDSYMAWSGMDADNMEEVEVAYALDSLGNEVFRMNNATGRREPEKALRPTYLQQARYMLGYQIGYMYLRYLMWNFSGRQNNIPSTGEIDHGNFITGIDPIDDMMLGAQSSMPRDLKDDNRGYNRYFMIPFLLGLVGACLLPTYGRRGRRVLYITGILFVMTGIGIVVYLNQDPGEPRERDYSFLGSYLAFAMWIGFAMAEGFAALRRSGGIRLGKVKPKVWRYAWGIVAAGVPCLMLSQTYDDHQRSGRDVATAIASNILKSLEKDAVIFVDGDNVIFPLWYAQEVLGIRRDVTVVETGYLITDWYRRQLALPGEESLPLAVSQEIPEGPGSMSDRVVRDIITRNSLLPRPRPVYWHSSLNERSNFKPYSDRAFLTLFTYKYLNDTSAYGDDAAPSPRLAALLEGERAVPSLMSGGTENGLFYAEPYVAAELARQRYALMRLAKNLRAEGYEEKADSIAAAANRLWPLWKVPPIGGEGLPESFRQRRRDEYLRYYNAMPEERRSAISRESMGVLSVVGSH